MVAPANASLGRIASKSTHSPSHISRSGPRSNSKSPRFHISIISSTAHCPVPVWKATSKGSSMPSLSGKHMVISPPAWVTGEADSKGIGAPSNLNSETPQFWGKFALEIRQWLAVIGVNKSNPTIEVWSSGTIKPGTIASVHVRPSLEYSRRNNVLEKADSVLVQPFTSPAPRKTRSTLTRVSYVATIYESLVLPEQALFSANNRPSAPVASSSTVVSPVELFVRLVKLVNADIGPFWKTPLSSALGKL